MFTELTPAPLSTGTKPALGFTALFPSGKLIIAYPNGSISQARGDIGTRASFDGGAHWKAEKASIAQTGADLSNIGGGVLPSGRFIVAYHKQNFSTGEHLGLFYRNSDDEGVGFGSEKRLSDLPDEHAYGAAIEIGGGKVLLPSYRYPSATEAYPVVRISSDNCDSFGLPINVCPPGSGYNETTFVYLGGSCILAIARIVNGGTYLQFKSVDNGESWIDQGATSFESWTPGTHIESPAWLTRFRGADGRGMVACFYVNRQTHKLRCVKGSAAALLSGGPSEWGSPETVMDTYATDQYGAGYPSAVQQGAYSLGWFYDFKEGSSTEKIIRFFTL